MDDSERKEPPPRSGAAAFVLLTFGFSWGAWLPVILAAGLEGTPTWALTVIGLWGPFLAGALLSRLERGSWRSGIGAILRLGAPVQWYLLAFLVPAGVFGLVLLGFVVGGGSPDLEPGPGAGAYPVFFLVALVLAGGQEEPGWRGYALPVLQQRTGTLAASLLVGVVWGLWHLPLFLMPGTPLAEVSPLAFVPAIVAFSVLLTWVTNGSGAVGPAIVMHAQVNALGPFVGMPLDALWTGLVWVGSGTALLVVFLGRRIGFRR